MSRDEFETMYDSYGSAFTLSLARRYGRFDIYYLPKHKAAVVEHLPKFNVKVIKICRQTITQTALEQAHSIAKRLNHLYPLHFMAKEYPRNRQGKKPVS